MPKPRLRGFGPVAVAVAEVTRQVRGCYSWSLREALGLIATGSVVVLASTQGRGLRIANTDSTPVVLPSEVAVVEVGVGSPVAP